MAISLKPQTKILSTWARTLSKMFLCIPKALLL